MSILAGKVNVPDITDTRQTTPRIRDHIQASSRAAERRADIAHWAGVATLLLLTAVTVWAAITFGPAVVEFFWTEQ